MNNLPIIATLGGHSALEICLGAKRSGFGTLVIVQNGRDKTYTKYFHNLIDESIIVDNFSQITDKDFVQKLKEKNCIFIPHRYVQVYCDMHLFEKNVDLPIFGNKYLLKHEERDGIYNQYQILFESQIDYPLQFKDPKDIDRFVIIKVKEAERNYERAFFFAKNYKTYKDKSQKLLSSGKINEHDLQNAIIEEYIIGAQVNFNFFYSPLTDTLELLGTDMRRQTNIDGILRIPAATVMKLTNEISPSYIETGHIAVTVKESLLEQAFFLAEKFINTTKAIVPPGVIGPFALQTAIIPGPPKEKIVVYDLSLRIPGSPGTSSTPYSQYHFGRPVSFGERIAMEIQEATKQDKLRKITT